MIDFFHLKDDQHEATVKRFLIILTFLLIPLGLSWLILTLYVQYRAPEGALHMGDRRAEKRALIVYHPDPFYNLDEQACKAFAAVMVDHGWYAEVLTVATASLSGQEDFELYVFCANTYNCAPEKAVDDYIRDHGGLENKHVVAMTLGSGNTQRAQRLLEARIESTGAMCQGSREFWLLKPNNIYRLDEDNALVAVDMVKEFAHEVLQSMD